MSDTTNELDQLRADYAAIKTAVGVHKKYNQRTPSDTVSFIESRIRQLETEAEPWSKAKEIVRDWRGRLSSDTTCGTVAAYALDLQARVAELEAKLAEPADRDRILVTACKLIAADKSIADGQTLAGYLLQLTRCGGARFYEVKERTNKQ